MSFLPDDFGGFIAPGCDRRTFLENLLKKAHIDFDPITTEACVHLCVRFPSSAYNSLFKIKTVLVHYDRACAPDGSFITPGANDNSAAVFQVLRFAERLMHNEIPLPGGVHNMRIFFTDGEELGASSVSGAKAQGAFALASLFRKLGIVNDDVFVLDGCGRGDVLTVSTAGKNSNAPLGFAKRFDALFAHACSLAKEASKGKWISVPVPYGDNAGFLSCGIPAVALTVLPSDEAAVYMRQLQKDKAFAQAVMNRGVAAHGAGFLSKDLSAGSAAGKKNTAALSPAAELRKKGIDPAQALLLSEKLPRTWRLMHTMLDDETSLTPQSFALMERFLNLLALSRRCM